MNKEGSAMRK